MTTSAHPVFVLTAEIAARLHYATIAAQRITLIAKNARSITARAGANAVGFRAITDYIEYFAKSMITTAITINNTAVEISRLASQHAWNNKTLDSVLFVYDQPHDITHLSTIDNLRDFLQKEERQYKIGFTDKLRKLSSWLDESVKQVRAAYIIASTSQIEASQSGPYEPELVSISNEIRSAADEITEQVQQAKRLLQEAIEK
ncbi:hypothetical protein [Pleionea sp. CnH1-48]|uniref:hypothetical protein n=1 Tax=Pleionea sp. CnH1-48 TaxID=2954494 RepID=UPI0020983E53|nr:hypothetical protein [Pleionea sp. CnH1-48]MCO7223290.1 hypothetical protein [Pleionea sp. CnH1-48]